MSPTVFREKGYRFYFFSREETRIHIHVSSSRGEAKFWIEPHISLAINYDLTKNDLTEIIQIIKERRDEIIDHWKEHLNS